MRFATPRVSIVVAAVIPVLVPGPQSGSALGHWTDGVPSYYACSTLQLKVLALDGDVDGVVAGGDPTIGDPVAIIDGDPVVGPWTVTTLPPPGAGLLWGASVARDGDRIAVGAPGAGDAGMVVLFERDASGTWTSVASIDAPVGSAAGSHFGAAVALEGTRLIVGAPDEDVAGSIDAGAIHVYDLAGGLTALAQTMHADRPATSERFGAACALDGDGVVVGSPGSGRSGVPASGAVWSGTFDGAGVLTLGACITSPSPQAGARLGASVALHGTLLAAGAPDASVHATMDGSAVVAALSDGGTWQVTELSVPGAPAHAHFGTSLVMNHERVIVGTAWDAPMKSRDFRLVRGAWIASASCNVDGALCRYGHRVAGGLKWGGGAMAIASIDLDCTLPDPDLDCNHNAIPDACDILDDVVPDLDLDGAPDGCALAVTDIATPGGSGSAFARSVSHGRRLLVLPMRSGIGELTVGPPSLVASSESGDIASFTLPFEGASYWGGSPLAIGVDWCATGGVTFGATGTVGTITLFSIGDDGDESPAVEAMLTATAIDDGFGFALASHADELWASTPNDPAGIHPIRRFSRGAGGRWSELDAITIDEPGPSTGTAIAWDGARVAIADATPADATWDTGRVRIAAVGSRGALSEEAQLRLPAGTIPATARFGSTLTLVGDRLVVASEASWSPFVAGLIQHVAIFRRTADGSWLLEGQVSAAELGGARTIAVQGTRIAIGRATGTMGVVVRTASGAWASGPALASGTLGWKLVPSAALLDDGLVAAIAEISPGLPPPLTACVYDPVDDCNGNAVDDSVDIASGAPDLNGNGIPDACERPGDMNDDGSVDGVDLGILLGRFGLGPGVGDCTDDGAVNEKDVALLLADWGSEPR